MVTKKKNQSRSYLNHLVHRFSYKVPVILVRFNEMKISRQIFFFFNNTHISTAMKNPSSGSQVATCGRVDGRKDGQTDRHDEPKSRFSLFCEGA